VFRQAVLTLTALLLVPGAGALPTAHGSPTRLRVLYAADWTGQMQIFAADPAGRAPVRQVTFARPDGDCFSAAACGSTRPQPSPNGRWLAYWSTARPGIAATLWLAQADGSGARRLAAGSVAAWSPDSRRLAYSAADGIHVLTIGGADRIIDRATTDALAWSPDGSTLAFGDRRGLILLRRGHERVLEAQPPESLAWAQDGRKIGYTTSTGISIVVVRGGSQRVVYRFDVNPPECWPVSGLGPSEVAFSPNGRLLAFVDENGTPGFLDTRTWRARTVRDSGHGITWAPDGRSVVFVQGCQDAAGESLTSGDVQTITPTGHVHTLVSASKPGGGQIVSANWAAVPANVRYLAPQPVTGVFAGGPVQKLAADGDRVGFASCGRVSVWDEATTTTTAVQTTSSCYAASSREGHVGTLALAGDRVLWWSAYTGLGFRWSMYQATLGTPPSEVANGSGNLGSTPGDGSGTALGAGSLLVMSTWALHLENGSSVVDRQAIQRVDPAGCPCPAISASRGPYTPLDVDRGRIVVSGPNGTRILAGDGTILVTLPVSTLAAQLDGSQLVIATGDELQVYDASTGALRARWPLTAGPVGHDCDIFTDPTCGYGQPTAPLTLEDVSRGIAAYIDAGQVHVLRLGDGTDQVVGYGTVARFTNAGLVYADGARIWLTPYSRLPVQ
jgi:hypothetical protein